MKWQLCTKHFCCIKKSFGLFGRGRGWDDLGEWHWNMYSIIYETSCKSRFDARYWMLRAGALGRPRGMVWGGRREEGSGWGTRVYLWWIHFDIWQNQYNIVKFKNKIKLNLKNMSANLENSAVATGLGKGQFSLQSPRKSMQRMLKLSHSTRVDQDISFFFFFNFILFLDFT